MATPTLISLTPSTGLVSGDQIVAVTGTNFNTALQSNPRLNDPYIVGLPTTVEVLFGTTPAKEVCVFSSTYLTALLPASVAGAGPVSVTVTNIDQTTGLPNAGETVTVTAAFNYAVPIMTSETAYESDFTRAQGVLLDLITNQLGIKATYAVQTDYDPITGDELHVTQFAQLPGLSLVGPELTENRFYSLNEEPVVPDGSISKLDGVSSAGFLRTRVPYTVDVVWDVVCASNTKVEFLNLMAAFTMFMHKNKWLYMPRNPANLSAGTVRFELDFVPGEQPKKRGTPNNSNIVVWYAKILIRGFPIEYFAGITDATLDPAGLIPSHAVVQHGQNADIVRLVEPQETG